MTLHQAAEIANLLAVVVGPIVAVSITLWWQERKEKRDAKLQLFLTLMAHRKATPPTYEWVRALNLIDVVFAEHAQVVALWHELYQLLNNPSTPEAQGHKSLALLSEMGSVLGFKKLQQIDIDKFYCPQAHVDQLKINAETQAELLRVLKKTACLPVEKKAEDAKS